MAKSTHNTVFCIVVMVGLFFQSLKADNKSPGEKHHYGNLIHHQLKHSESKCMELFRCYDILKRYYGDTYHTLCTVKEKFKHCKQVFIESHSTIYKECANIDNVAIEAMYDFFCAHDARLYKDFLSCRKSTAGIPTIADYEPQVFSKVARAILATNILQITGITGDSPWRPGHKYNRNDPEVYKVLVAHACANYESDNYRARLMMNWCAGDVIDAYVNITTTKRRMDRKTDGLVGWHPDQCKNYSDPLDQILSISFLSSYFANLIRPDLGQCHPNNILVRGIDCLMMFHVISPPFTDLHAFLPSLCRGRHQLRTCWSPVRSSCTGSLVDFMDNIISSHQLVCDIGNDVGVQAFVVDWAEAFLARNGCQLRIQRLNILSIIYRSALVPNSPYGKAVKIAMVETMDCHLTSLSQVIQNMTSNHTAGLNENLMELYAKFNHVRHVVEGDVTLRLLEIDHNFISLIAGICDWLKSLFVTFWAESGFITKWPLFN